MAVPSGESVIATETIACVNFKLKSSRRTEREGRQRKGGSWLAMMEPMNAYYNEKHVGVPKAVLTVRRGEAAVPLLNASWEEKEVRIEPQVGKLRVKAIREVYHKEVIDKNMEEGNKSFYMDDKGRVVKTITLNAEAMEAGVEGMPEIPLERDEPPAFPIRPPTEHLKEKLKPENLTELDRLLAEFRDIFCKNKTDIGFTTFEKHDIELVEGAVPHRENTSSTESGEECERGPAGRGSP